MTRPNLESELETIHKVCHYIKSIDGNECQKCDYYIRWDDEKCQPLCIGIAEELILIVRTGDPWGRGDGSWPRKDSFTGEGLE